MAMTTANKMGAILSLVAATFVSLGCGAGGGSHADRRGPATSGGRGPTPPTFDQVYGLKGDEAIRRVLPPLEPARSDFVRDRTDQEARESLDHEPGAIVVKWKRGTPTLWGRKSSTIGWYTLQDLVRSFVGASRWELEGHEALQYLRLEGDFVVNGDATSEQYRAGIEKIVSEELGRPVTLAFREVERLVVVLKGNWIYKPVGGKPWDPSRDGPQKLELYVTGLNQDGDYGALKDLDSMAAAVSNCIGQPVVIECPDAPADLLLRDNTFVGENPAMSPARSAAVVLKHLEEQTGLTAVEETRKVRRLLVFVERAE